MINEWGSCSDITGTVRQRDDGGSLCNASREERSGMVIVMGQEKEVISIGWMYRRPRF